jgi:hypothetical protein
MKVSAGSDLSPTALAKLVGQLERKVYPASVRCGWRDFLEDFTEHGSDHTVVVIDDTAKNTLAYLVAFADPEEGIYVSDIARDPALRGAEHELVMVALLSKAAELFQNRIFYAELRMPSRRLLHTFCDVHEEHEIPDYYPDGQSALQVRATLRPDFGLEAVAQYAAERARASSAGRRANTKRHNAQYTLNKTYGRGLHGEPRLVDEFYAELDTLYPGKNEVPIPPRNSVRPQQTIDAQTYTFVDFATRKLAPIALECITDVAPNTAQVYAALDALKRLDKISNHSAVAEAKAALDNALAAARVAADTVAVEVEREPRLALSALQFLRRAARAAMRPRGQVEIAEYVAAAAAFTAALDSERAWSVVNALLRQLSKSTNKSISAVFLDLLRYNARCASRS